MISYLVKFIKINRPQFYLVSNLYKMYKTATIAAAAAAAILSSIGLTHMALEDNIFASS